MYFQNESFSVILNDNTLEFSGKIELPDYKELLKFLKEAEKNIKANETLINLKNLCALGGLNK